MARYRIDIHRYTEDGEKTLVTQFDKGLTTFDLARAFYRKTEPGEATSVSLMKVYGSLVVCLGSKGGRTGETGIRAFLAERARREEAGGRRRR